MAPRPPRPCARCGVIITEGYYCPRHQQEFDARRREADRDRGSRIERGYDNAWRKARRSYIQQHPLCAECLRQGRTTAAEVVHHITPIEVAPRLRLDAANLMALCRGCHETLHERRKNARPHG